MVAGVSVFLNTVSMLFRVYLSNRVGSAELGLHQLVFSVYVMMTTLAASGIQLAVTRLVSTALVTEDLGRVRKIMRCSFLYGITFGTVAACLLFFGAEAIGHFWIHETASVPSLRILAFGLPCMAISSSVHGYLTARRFMMRSGLMQIGEEFSKIGTTVFFLWLFQGDGIAYQCAALVLGSLVGEWVACLLGLFFYFRSVRIWQFSGSSQKILPSLAGIALPIAVGAYARSGLSMAENMLIPRGLRLYGLPNETALSLVGVLRGMVFPILYFPSALLSAFARLLVPEISEANTIHDRQKIERTSSVVMQLTLIFAIYVSAFFLTFSEELGQVFYRDERAGRYLHLLAPLVPLMYLDSMVDAVLKGMDQQMASMRYNILDSGVRVIAVFFVLPYFGFDGYLVILYFSTCFNAFLSIRRFLRVTEIVLPVRRFFLIPILSAAAAMLPLSLCSRWTAQSFPILLLVLISLTVYLICLYGTGCIRRRDLQKWRILLKRGSVR